MDQRPPAARGTGAILREVGFDGRSFAVTHCGRVIGFLVPVEGRAPVKRGSSTRAPLKKTWFGYELTPEGVRHAEELGL